MPSFSATRALYSLDVAQALKVFAASLALELVGIANAQEYNQAEPLSVTSWGA